MTSLHIVPGSPGRARPRCQLPAEVSTPSAALDDDAQREMQRTTCADDRARQLEVGPRVDEHPRVLVTEPEEAELLEAPTHDALILE